MSLKLALCTPPVYIAQVGQKSSDLSHGRVGRPRALGIPDSLLGRGPQVVHKVVVDGAQQPAVRGHQYHGGLLRGLAQVAEELLKEAKSSRVLIGT